MQKHIQRYPSCPFVCGQIAGVNLMPPALDDDHPTIRLMKRVDEVIKKVSLLSRLIVSSQTRLEIASNLTASLMLSDI